MKVSSNFARLLVVVSGLGVAAVAGAAEVAPLVIFIDDSDPAAVTFTATGFPSTGSDSGHTFSEGVDLTAFFTAATAFTPAECASDVVTTSLTTAQDGTPLYDSIDSDDLSGSEVDLRIYTPAGKGDPTETFVAGSPAFIGQATIDLSGTDLPVAGTVGAIFAGYSGDDDINDVTSLSVPGGDQVLIGSYVVVPEPRTTVLLQLASTGVVLTVRRKLA